MQITLIQNSQERKLGGFPVLWEIFFPFGKGRGGREWGVVALFFTARCRSLWLISKKVQSEAQLDIHWFLNLKLLSNCPSKPKDWGLSK